MALHIIVESGTDVARSWRAEIDPHDGWTCLFDGVRRIASAAFCGGERWERVDPDIPAVRTALQRVAATLARLGFTPVRPNPACGTDGADCEAG